MSDSTGSSELQECLDRLRSGDPAARAALLERSRERLGLLTRKMLRRYPSVRRWEEAEDVFHRALLRLDRMLQDTVPLTVLDYLKLASTHIRRELIDLARHYGGPEGMGTNHATPGTNGDSRNEVGESSSDGPVQLAAWSEVHRRISLLPDEQRETFDLLWYQGLQQDEAAEVLHVSLNTVKRRWLAARLALAEALGGELPF